MPPTDPPPENLRKDLVQHLSKEIETTANNMMLFRTRIGFSLCIGPFLLLGSFIIGTKGQPVATNFKWYGWLALIVVAICYLGIAYMGSVIELHAMQQCNEWRTIIEQICKNPSMELDTIKLEQGLVWTVPILRHERSGVKTAYFVGYLLLFVGVIAAVFIVSAGTTPPQSYSGNGATFHIEQITPTPQQK